MHRHHVIYAQELVRGAASVGEGRALLADERNLVPVAFRCHEKHHSRFRPLALSCLPDSVFEFASETLGSPAAYEYLRRRYAGDDPRLDALLEEDFDPHAALEEAWRRETGSNDPQGPPVGWRPRR